MSNFNPFNISDLSAPFNDPFSDACTAMRRMAEAVEELQGEVADLKDEVAELKAKLEGATAKPARPTDAEYLEYRPDGAGHDAPNMPF